MYVSMMQLVSVIIFRNSSCVITCSIRWSSTIVITRPFHVIVVVVIWISQWSPAQFQGIGCNCVSLWFHLSLWCAYHRVVRPLIIPQIYRFSNYFGKSSVVNDPLWFRFGFVTTINFVLVVLVSITIVVRTGTPIVIVSLKKSHFLVRHRYNHYL